MKRILRFLLILAASGCIAFPAFADTALGQGSQGYRNRVIAAAGISDLENLDALCTRGEFARMLVLSSSAKDITQQNDGVAAASDVPAGNANAAYIRTALRNGWMRTRIGGTFDPDAPVTLLDASKAAMTMLSYTDSDFAGNLSQLRLSKFKSLELLSGVPKSELTDTLTKQECLNILYNLLRTKPKGGSSIYGAAINLSLAQDGELNATELVEVTLKGPFLAKSWTEVQSIVPFDLKQSAMYYNGNNTGSYTQNELYYNSQLQQAGWIILYYSENSKSVWAYGYDTGANAYHCVRGTVTLIEYSSDNIVSPDAVYIDGTKYNLNSADVKFMFSVNGEIRTGDDVVLVCKKPATYSDEDTSDYYGIAVMKYTRNGPSGAESDSLFAQHVTRVSRG